MTKISVVTAMYKNQDYVEEFCKRIKKVINKLGVDYEIILVNDNSPENDLNVALKYRETDSNVKIINFAKNYGQHVAILAGLEKSSGDYVAVIDIDLEEKPEYIEDLYDKIIKSKSDVVYSIRKDVGFSGLFQRFCRKIFWLLFSFISDYNLKKNISNARIMNRKFCEALIQHKERGWLLPMITQICGFKQECITIERVFKNKSSYSFFKRLGLFFSLILNYSNKPIYSAIYVGLIISSLSFAIGIYITIQKLIYGIPVDGWSSIMVSIWLLGGAIIFFLGVIGTYIANIFIDVKQRPLFIIKDSYGFKDD